MPKFNPGDRVVRIGASNSKITKGQEYTVKDVEDDGLLWLVEVEGTWYSNLFELAKWVPKTGDIVTVNNALLDGWPYACGTFSKTYQLQKSHPNGLLRNPNTGNKENLWSLKNDEGEFFWVADHQLIRADGTQPSVPQRKKRIYNA